MKIGDAIPTPNIQAYHKHGWNEYKAPKGEHFVFLLLGTMPKDSDKPFGAEAALNRMGWEFDPDGLREALEAMRGPFRDYVHAAGPADERDAEILAMADKALGPQS